MVNSSLEASQTPPTRRTVLKSVVVGVVAVAAVRGGSIVDFFVRADRAATAAAATGWTVFDGFLRDVSLTVVANGVEELAKRGIADVYSALQTNAPTTYKALPHVAKHPATGTLVFPAEPIGEPKLSKLVYFLTPNGELIDFLPRAIEALGRVSQALQAAKGMTPTEASNWLLPITRAQDLGSPPSDKSIEFNTLRGRVQVFNVPSGSGSREVVTVAALAESWEFPVSPGSVVLQ